MSLQDDYFDLKASLRGENKKRFLRVWEAFCEAENDELLEISRGVRMMIEGTFK
jgi:myo-inositol catabolism protein IolC